MTIVLLVILIIVLLLLALGYAAFFFGVVRINTHADPKFAKSLAATGSGRRARSASS